MFRHQQIRLVWLLTKSTQVQTQTRPHEVTEAGGCCWRKPGFASSTSPGPRNHSFTSTFSSAGDELFKDVGHPGTLTTILIVSGVGRLNTGWHRHRQAPPQIHRQVFRTVLLQHSPVRKQGNALLYLQQSICSTRHFTSCCKRSLLLFYLNPNIFKPE